MVMVWIICWIVGLMVNIGAIMFHYTQSVMPVMSIVVRRMMMVISMMNMSRREKATCTKTHDRRQSDMNIDIRQK